MQSIIILYFVGVLVFLGITVRELFSPSKQIVGRKPKNYNLKRALDLVIVPIIWPYIVFRIVKDELS